MGRPTIPWADKQGRNAIEWHGLIGAHDEEKIITAMRERLREAE
jgi:hypothetical protein